MGGLCRGCQTQGTGVHEQTGRPRTANTEVEGFNLNIFPLYTKLVRPTSATQPQVGLIQYPHQFSRSINAVCLRNVSHILFREASKNHGIHLLSTNQYVYTVLTQKSSSVRCFQASTLPSRLFADGDAFQPTHPTQPHTDTTNHHTQTRPGPSYGGVGPSYGGVWGLKSVFEGPVGL